jgi:ribose 5-phosphate isomerase A
LVQDGQAGRHDAEALKREAAARAVALVEPGMRLGLGTGSTARHFVDLLGARVREGLPVTGVPTSRATADQAAALGIHLTTLDETPRLDLTVDGADEIDPRLRLIKGGGGAHLREKIVACASARMIVIADESKQVAELGRFPLPVEVVEFGLGATRLAVAAALDACCCPCTPAIRMRDGVPVRTDSGNLILDCPAGRIPDPESLADRLDRLTGVVEHGLFIAIASAAILATPSGVRIIGDMA